MQNKECKSCGTENYHEFLSCEFCGKAMTEEDHNFCDICGECREDLELWIKD